MSNIQKLNEKFEQLKNQMQTEYKNELNSIVSEIFKKYPAVESVGWNQYTPYFNDGDECVFSANLDSLYVKTSGQKELEDSDEDDNNIYWCAMKSAFENNTDYEYTKYGELRPMTDEELEAYMQRWPRSDREAVKKYHQTCDSTIHHRPLTDDEKFAVEIGIFLSQIPQEQFYTMFGDHVTVTIQKDGTIITDEYEHD